MIKVISPTELELIGYDNNYDELKKFLTFKNTSNVFKTQRLKKNKYLANKLSSEDFHALIEEAKAAETVCLLTEKNGRLFTLAGLAHVLAEKFQDQVISEVNYPEPVGIPWYREPEFELRYYQKDAIEALISNMRGAVSLPTASGKSRVVLELAKYYGLKTIIMAPSSSIVKQLAKDLQNNLGERYVGQYGAGKKKLNKLITIATGQALGRVKVKSKEFEELQDVKVLIVDESHTTAVETFSNICLNLFKNTPYRFFLSATQFRNDGTDKLLLGLTDKILYKKEATELVNQGYLSKPYFYIDTAKSTSSYKNDDVLRMIDKHVYKNKELHIKAAEWANKLIKDYNFQVLIMLDKIDQFTLLLPHLRCNLGFAYGGLGKNKEILPKQYHKSDPNKLVEQFDSKEFPLLVGTGAIGVGTDIKYANAMINLQAGKSPIKFWQSVGRGMRRPRGKDKFMFIDFDIINVPILHNMAEYRVAIYREIYDNVSLAGG